MGPRTLHRGQLRPNQIGGEGGIRTLERLPVTPLAGARLQPLGHLSTRSGRIGSLIQIPNLHGIWPPGRIPTRPQRPQRPGTITSVAERVGFEPTNACALPVFKTGAVNRLATSPRCAILARFRMDLGRGARQSGRILGVNRDSLRGLSPGLGRISPIRRNRLEPRCLVESARLDEAKARHQLHGAP